VTTRGELAHTELTKRIASAGRRAKRRAAAVGLARSLTVFVCLAAPLIVTDSLVVLPVPVRTVWLLASLAFLVWSLACWVARPLARRIDVVAVAARIEHAYPELGETLEAATELWEKRGGPRLGYSVELIDGLVDRAATEAAGLDFGAAVKRSGGRRWTIALAAVVAASVAAGVLVGDGLGEAAGRLARPFAAPAGPRVVVNVAPGDTTLVAGERLVVRAVVEGSSEEPVLVYGIDSEGEERAPMLAGNGSPPLYRAAVGDVRRSLRYSVLAGGLASGPYDVRVIDRPFVAGIRLELAYPRHTGLAANVVDENNGSVTVPRGTTISLSVTASKPVEGGALVFEDGTRLSLDRAGRADLEGALVVDESARYRIELRDVDGLTNPDPPTYSIVAVRDEYPLVRIVEPGEDRDVPREMTLPIVVTALDDYGIASLALRYSVQGAAAERVIPFDVPGGAARRELVREAVWDLSETGVMPGASIVYFAEVTDGDAVSGPKTARSESYVLRFPSMSELYREVTEGEDVLAGDVEDLLAEQEEIRDEFAEIRDELRGDPEIDWQDEERVDAALEKQERVAEDIGSVADRMAELTETMSETDRATLESIEKMEEITRLLDEVATDEMRRLIEDIREAMAALRPDAVSARLEQMSVSQEDHLRRLEQTLELLKRVKAEQALSDVARRADELAGRERGLAERAREDSDSSRGGELAEEQAGLAEEAGALRSDLDRATEEMLQADSKAAASMKEAAAAMDEAGTVGKMEEAREALESGETEAGASMCESAADDLATLFTSLSSCKSNAASSLTRRSSEATMRAVNELLGVSDEQEELFAAVRGRETVPRDEAGELVAKQADLLEAMSTIAGRMFEETKGSFAVNPVIYRGFASAQADMGAAAAFLADGKPVRAGAESADALAAVNALVVQLLTSNQKASGKGQSALEQLMQELQMLAGGQSKLNEMTAEIRREAGELGQEGGIERQLAEARALQERLLERARRLAEEFGERDEVLGRLDDTVDEMERALAAMERGGASQEVIDRQRRVLSRLLDAQRSVRRRDYTERRRSRAGADERRRTPSALPDEIARTTRELREDLLRAMQREYPLEYRELIRAYFEALARDAAAAADDLEAPSMEGRGEETPR